MQLSQIVRKTLRRLALTAVIGGGLATPVLYHGLSYGQQPPRPLTLPAQAIAKLEPVQESTPGTTVTPVQYEEPVEKASFFQKLFRGNRRAQIPNGPPQDPGMNYPKKSDFRATQPQARTAAAPQGNQSLELVPPGWNPNAPSGSLSAPAVSAPTVTSQDILVPPGGFGPAGGGQLVPPPTNALVPPAGNDLKAYLAETPKTSSSTAGLLVPSPADGGNENLSTLPPILPSPQLPAITPAPQIAASPQFEPPAITPGVAATQQPNLQAPSLDLTPVAPTAPATAKGWNGTARPGGADALTLTPAPVDKPVAIVEAPPAVTQQTAPAVSAPAAELMQQELADAVPEPDMSKPYTGLALEEDMFQPPIPVSGTTPTPQEPAPVVDATTQSTSEPVIAANTNPVPLPAPPVEPEQVPELPPIGESTVTIESNGVGTVEIPATTTDTAAPALQTPPPLVLAPGLPAVPQATPQQHAPVVTAPTTQQAAVPKDEREEKMALIRSRTGMSGLKGFCAVALRDDRELLDTNEEFSALFNGKLYSFSSEENLERFLQEPVRYAPASRGNDVIHLALTGEEVEGSLDHAVWYQGRLYLFTSVETLETFTAAPSSHAVYE